MWSGRWVRFIDLFGQGPAARITEYGLDNNMASLALARANVLIERPSTICVLSIRKTSQFVKVRSVEHGGHTVATVTLNKPPVNSFDSKFTDELVNALRSIEESKEVDALVLKSDCPNVFSSGLDLNDLFSQPRSHLELFWRRVQDLWLQLYSSKLPTVAAINGHCLAAGTILAGACDYRVAVDGDYGIGVTAAKIGLIAPPWFLKMLVYTMGQRKTELALQLGRVFTPKDAMTVGLVDKVCTKDSLDTECWKSVEPFLHVSAESRATMKLSLRGDLIESFLKSREEDLDFFVSFILRDSVQDNLSKYIQQLKSRTRK